MSSKLLVAFALLASASQAHAQCTKDTDCKGDRICELGRCITPASTPARVASPAPPVAPPQPQPVVVYLGARPRAPKAVGGYAAIAALFSFAGHGDLHQIDWRPGVLVSGYGALTNRFHFGGYFAFSETSWSTYSVYERSYYTRTYSTGIALKAGSWIGDRVWLGLQLEQGVRVFTATALETAVGTEVAPRLHVDALVLRRPVALGLSAAIGPQVIWDATEKAVVFASATLGIVVGR
jgi:hypothetical protein